MRNNCALHEKQKYIGKMLSYKYESLIRAIVENLAQKESNESWIRAFYLGDNPRGFPSAPAS